MKPTVGTILEFTPREGRAEFTGDGETWTEPILGIATVVTYSLTDEYETSLEFVVLEDDKYPSTITSYLQGRVDGTELVNVRLNHGSN